MDLVLVDAVVWRTWTDAQISDYNLGGHTGIPSEEACKQLCVEVGMAYITMYRFDDSSSSNHRISFVRNIKKYMTMYRPTCRLCFVHNDIKTRIICTHTKQLHKKGIYLSNENHEHMLE